MLGAVALFTVGLRLSAYSAVRERIELEAAWLADVTLGVLVTATAAGCAVAVLRRRRGASERAERLQTEATYQVMIEQVPAVAYAWDPAKEPGTAAAPYISPRIESLLGFTAQEWLDDPQLWARQVHQDDLGAVNTAWHDAVSSGGAFASEYRISSADGREVWIRDEAEPVTTGGVTRYQGVMLDISERKEAERRVAEARERYRSLVEQLPAVVYIDEVDDLATARYVSPRYERLTGYTQAERLADPGLWMRIVHAEDRDRVLGESARTNETGEDYDIEHRIVHRSGRVVWVHDHASLVRAPDGGMAWQGVLTDITDRRLAEEALGTRDRILEAAGFAAERFLRAPSWREHIDEVLARLGGAGDATRVGVFENVETAGSHRVELEHAWIAADAPASLGRTSSLHTVGSRPSWDRLLAAGEVIHGPTRELPASERDAFEAHGIRSVVVMPVFVEDRWWGSIGLDDCHSDRTWHPAEIDAIRVVGNTLGAAIEREEGARRLSEAEIRYRAIVEHVPAAIYLDEADRSMRTIYVSPQIEEITGVSPQEWIEDPEVWLTIMSPEDRAETERSYRASVDAKQPWKAEYRVNTRDGRTIWLHDETTFVTDQQGNPLFLQGVLMDITERKLAEQALRASERHERDAAERLRALDEMKNTFLAAVSHELRSPLTSILGLALTLERSPMMPGEDRDDLLGRLAFNARKLDRLLKDLLDIDRLNRGIVHPQYRTVDLASLARRSIESLDLGPGRRIEADLRTLVQSIDPPKLERIVENLVMNAARHTPATSTIWVRLEEVDGGALLMVEDDGPGIPAALRDAVFEPFRQGPTASPHSPGTGVGLSLVAKFAELHGGRAWVQDREGGGASFRVFLPPPPGTVEPADASTSSAEPASAAPAADGA